jgi:hypothetical protein
VRWQEQGGRRGEYTRWGLSSILHLPHLAAGTGDPREEVATPAILDFRHFWFENQEVGMTISRESCCCQYLETYSGLQVSTVNSIPILKIMPTSSLILFS